MRAVLLVVTVGRGLAQVFNQVPAFDRRENDI